LYGVYVTPKCNTVTEAHEQLGRESGVAVVRKQRFATVNNRQGTVHVFRLRIRETTSYSILSVVYSSTFPS